MQSTQFNLISLFSLIIILYAFHFIEFNTIHKSQIHFIKQEVLMEKIGDLFKSSDWKKEKHVPVIECPEEVAAGELFQVKVTLGKEIPHPNTTEHHIRWIQLFFMPEGDNFPYQIGHFEFNAHGESVKGANEGPVYAEPTVIADFKIKVSGKFFAMAYCNIHGLWEGSTAITVK